MVKGDGKLTQQALDLLDALAKRRGWSELSNSDMVVELARDALATYLIVDVSQGDSPMTAEDKEDPQLKASEIMRRTYAEWEKKDPFKHMTDEEVLDYAGERLHSHLLELEQREKEEKLPGTLKKVGG